MHIILKNKVDENQVDQQCFIMKKVFDIRIILETKNKTPFTFS